MRGLLGAWGGGGELNKIILLPMHGGRIHLVILPLARFVLVVLSYNGSLGCIGLVATKAVNFSLRVKIEPQ